MPMSEKLLEVRLSPAEGQMFGTFTEGMPISEVMGKAIAIQVDGKEGERVRHYGIVMGAHDNLLNIDNKRGGDEQVLTTEIFFMNQPEPLTIVWRQVRVAVADVAETS